MHPFLALALLATAPPAPAWLAGDWEPYSNAFIGLGMLRIAPGRLSWKECRDVPYEVLSVAGDSVTLALADDSRCLLGGAPPARIDSVRLTLRPNRCDPGVTLYATPAARANNVPDAEGLYGKPACPSGPVSHAAANLSTTPR